MPQFPLPPISWKNASIIIGVLFLVIIFTWSGGALPMSNSLGITGSTPSFGAPSVARDYAYDGSSGVFQKGGYGMEESAGAIAPMPPMPGPDAAPAGESKIVKNGSLALVVSDVDEAAAKIRIIRAELGGQEGNATFNEYAKGSRAGEITIWVPSTKFDEAMGKLRALAIRVEHESVNVTDVSAQFVDLEARLANLKRTEEQYAEILKRSGKLSDVLDVTRELSNTRSQIEQLEGQMNYLSRQVALSAIRVSLRSEASPKELKNEWRPIAIFKSAAKEMLAGLIDFANDVIVLLVMLPLLIVRLGALALVLWVIWRIGRFVHRRAFPVKTNGV